jgi:hypothetical protein
MQQFALDDAPALGRFHEKVRRDPVTGCWLWQGASMPQPTNPGNRYGYVWDDDRMVYAHRRAYELFIGSIPAGLTIDHLCRTTLCVNPQHLEAVPHLINVQRGNGQRHIPVRGSKPGTCKRGHPWIEPNTYIDIRGRFRCRQCNAERMRRSRATGIRLSVILGDGEAA